MANQSFGSIYSVAAGTVFSRSEYSDHLVQLQKDSYVKIGASVFWVPGGTFVDLGKVSRFEVTSSTDVSIVLREDLEAILAFEVSSGFFFR